MDHTPDTVLFFLILLFIFCMVPGCGNNMHGEIPSEQTARFLMAQKQYYAGNREEALLQSGKIRQEYPGFTENNCLYARALYYEGREGEAACIWEEILEEEEYHIDAIKQLSRVYLGSGRAEEAETQIMKALSRSSEDPVLLYLLAKARICQNSLSDALALLTQADILMERQCEIYLKQASLYQSYGYYKESLNALKKGRALLSDDHPLVPAINLLNSKIEEELVFHSP